MINAIIDKQEGEYRLSVKGHSGYAQPGYDIVCSAVSVLVYALGEFLDARPALSATVYISSGDAEIKVKNDRNDSDINSAFEFLEHGFRIIESDASAYFSFEILG